MTRRNIFSEVGLKLSSVGVYLHPTYTSYWAARPLVLKKYTALSHGHGIDFTSYITLLHIFCCIWKGRPRPGLLVFEKLLGIKTIACCGKASAETNERAMKYFYRFIIRIWLWDKVTQEASAHTWTPLFIRYISFYSHLKMTQNIDKTDKTRFPYIPKNVTKQNLVMGWVLLMNVCKLSKLSL